MTQSQVDKIIDSIKLSTRVPVQEVDSKKFPQWMILIVVGVLGFLFSDIYEKNSNNPATFATLSQSVASNTATIADFRNNYRAIDTLTLKVESLEEVVKDLSSKTDDRYKRTDAVHDFTVEAREREYADTRMSEDIEESKKRIATLESSYNLIEKSLHEINMSLNELKN